MARIGVIGIAVTMAALACLPTDVCGCTPQVASAVLYGTVRASHGTPAAHTFIRLSAWTGSTCDSERSSGDNVNPAEFRADADGGYRAHVSSHGEPGPRCLRMTSWAATGSPPASTIVGGLIVDFRVGSEPLDSLGVILLLQ